ncbi:RNA 2'-phosphotransferase [Lysinibacillus sp. SGAir0095]|uniref:RNA 2'-phosphotransferase n=1 Tax=Lysinibacillus sp. SGAir0095 TaxID=2070463 RepID=UPI0010CD4F9B|nr:RNA 2'-phosphotransferase [Lysinibacillus sp. SGAir0095]QCR30834.1 RNA 2'-phosphotransferase [Lysinibacillus sp. SGAir0095]
MAVSTGFFKKIQRWTVDEHSGEILFLPFQADGNPYKSKVFLVGANPEPLLQVDASDIQILAETLVDSALFSDLFRDEIAEASREYKGSQNFASWLKGRLNEQVVLTSINLLNLESNEVKQLKKESDPLYLEGFDKFIEVLNEFEPEYLIIQGSTAYKLFLEQFKEQLFEKKVDDLQVSVQILEQSGIIAKLQLNNGENVNILVCRSMGAFGKEGKTFGGFKEKLLQLLQ